MVAIEAAAYSLPTVAFATGGIVDAVSEDQSGYLVEKNNYRALADKVIFALSQPLEKEHYRAFAKQFAWSKFGANIKHSLKYLHENR